MPFPGSYGPGPSSGYSPISTGSGSPPKKVSPPVAKAKQDFVYTDEDELRLERAARRAKLRAQRAGRKTHFPRPKGKQEPWFETLLNAMRPQAPVLPPIIDPTQSLLAGLAADVKDARQAASRQQAEANKALRNLGAQGGVAGAGVGDVYAGTQSALDAAQRGIGQGISADVAEFVLKQMQDRAQAQQGYANDLAQFQRSNMATPAQIAKLAQIGALGDVDLNNPFQVQAVLQGHKELSPSLQAQLHLAGIDPTPFRFDELGARIALGEKKQGALGRPSDDEVRALLLEALR